MKKKKESLRRVFSLSPAMSKKTKTGVGEGQERESVNTKMGEIYREK